MDNNGNLELLNNAQIPICHFNKRGNVGIGTNNPLYKLDVSGSVSISGNLAIGNTRPRVPLEIVSDQIIYRSNVWTIRNYAPDVYENNRWYSICYGNGLFVATAINGAIITSVDGINWISRTSHIYTWISVCYGNGLFVAIGQSSYIITSPDGINWTDRNVLELKNWEKICYGNGLFVVIGRDNGQIITSPDGIKWTTRYTHNTVYWSALCYGNGLFVAINTEGSVITSSNGIDWTSYSCPNNWWRSVCYGNGLFVAVSSNGTTDRVMTSPDGITWTKRTSATDNNYWSVCYGDGLFVAIADSGIGNRVMTSPDGITWTSKSTPADNGWHSVCYGNGLFIVVSTDGTNRIMTSGKQEKDIIPLESTTWNLMPTNMNNTYCIAGNVGIGTNNPSYPLDVSGSVNISNLLNISKLSENVYNAGSGSSLSLSYPIINGIVLFTPSANFTLNLTSIPTSSTTISYTISLMMSAQYYGNAITINGTSIPMICSGGLSNITINPSATYVSQEISVMYLNSATPVVTTNVSSLW
jgi:hypothetical protein